MAVDYANNWDAAKLLREMSPEEREHFRRELGTRKLYCVILQKPFNAKVCAFVEKRLKKEDDNGHL